MTTTAQPTEPATIIIPRINATEADAFFASLTQKEINFQTSYWSALKPINDTEVFQRFLFAFTSVHTTWESNIRAYSLIKNWWEWMNNWQEIENRLKESRSGLYNNRVRYIKDFSTKFWSNPTFYKKADSESWVEYRNRLEESILGLGMAKSSFSIEMMYPT
jgi:thermostable 8-oxoguanine DNA glycosylase